MAVAYGNAVYYGDMTVYYGARISYTVTYPSSTVGRVTWEMYGYHSGSMYDSVNNGGCHNGSLKSNTTFGSKTYSSSGGGTKSYASGTKDFTRSYYDTVDVAQNFFIEDLADSSGGGARSTATMNTTIAKRPSTTPEKPVDPTVTNITTTGCRINMLSYPADRGSTVTQSAFKIYDAASGGNVVAVYTENPKTLNHTFAGVLSTGTQYWAVTKAYNANGWSEESDRIAFTTASASAPDPCAAPSFSLITKNSARMSWVAPGTNGSAITGYTVQLATDAAFSNIVVNTTVSAATLLYDFSSLGLGDIQYWGRVAANSAAGSGSFGTSSFTTSPGEPDAPALPTIDAFSASDLTASSAAAGEHGSAVTGYRMQVATDAGFTAIVHDTTTAAFASRFAEGLAGDTEHFVRMLAESAAGDSAWSATASVTTLPGLWANDAGTFYDLEIWFNDPVEGWVQYELHYNDPSISWGQIA